MNEYIGDEDKVLIAATLFPILVRKVTHQIIREVWIKIVEKAFHWQYGKTETEVYCCCGYFANPSLGRRMIQMSAVYDVDDLPGPKK